MSKEDGTLLQGSNRGVPDNAIHRASVWLEAWKYNYGDATDEVSVTDATDVEECLERMMPNAERDYDGEDLLKAANFYGRLLAEIFDDKDVAVASAWMDGWLHGAGAMRDMKP